MGNIIGRYGEDDSLASSSGSDYVFGRSGDDRLYHSTPFVRGHDTLVGGLGQDTMYGSRDAQFGDDTSATFVFRDVRDSKLGDKSDVILRFDHTRDVLDFSSMDADKNTAGDQEFTYLGSATSIAAFTKTAGELLLVVKEGREFQRLVGDVDGDGRQDFAIKISLPSNLPLSEDNFIL